MAKAPLIPPIEITADVKALTKKYGGESFKRANEIALKRTTARALELVRRAFVQGGVDPDTGKPGFWPPKFGGGPILRKTGRYLASITMKFTGGDQPEGKVGTNVPYAKFHEQPGNKADFIEWKPTDRQRAFLFFKLGIRMRKAHKIRLPKRRVFVMPKPWQTELQDVYRRELSDALAKG